MHPIKLFQLKIITEGFLLRQMGFRTWISHPSPIVSFCSTYRQGQVKACNNGGFDFKGQHAIPSLIKITSFMGNLRI